MSDLEMVLTAPTSAPQGKTADYYQEDISPLFIPGGWENRVEDYVIPDYMGFFHIRDNRTGKKIRLFINDEDYDVIDPVDLPARDFGSHCMGRVHLVDPTTAEAGWNEGRLDLVGVAGDELRLINLSNLPCDVALDSGTISDFTDANPYEGLPRPYLVRLDDVPSGITIYNYHWQLRDLPPERKDTVYLTDFEIAALAHAMGRFDIVPIG